VRFGLAQLLRHRFDSTLQLGAFTLALFLVALLALVRSDLIAGWRQQLPPQAPNGNQVAHVSSSAAMARLPCWQWTAPKPTELNLRRRMPTTKRRTNGLPLNIAWM